jgi:hypothetical protein
MDKFKFYHGTSTFFLDSIRRTGLGAINPNFDLKNLEVVNFLYKLVKENNIQDAQLLIWEDSIRATIAQTDLVIRGQKFNYRHDGIYVAISKQRAAIYACLNKYGSEVLEKCIVLLEILDRHGINANIPPELDLFGVKNYISAESKPVMVEILEVDEEDLEKEDGKTAVEALDFIRKTIPTLSEKQHFEFLQYCNFKILKPVPPEKLRFYEIDFEGHPKNQDFEIYLTKI